MKNSLEKNKANERALWPTGEVSHFVLDKRRKKTHPHPIPQHFYGVAVFIDIPYFWMRRNEDNISVRIRCS